ncbi:Rrf2 family transcriptional regulator [Paenibacillus woosongensis]|uniref:Rrf2 family transcriptional regulator n=1 Tax=Paenibacillus woosongensis TaxID=307580 RepID=A0AA95I641_9BACL|nr:Rrf2 family transcriptional regulator [Paenibacillus woosongensis]WHX49696.1 Rrf2 family transcriptional regulator [Paenibacillus woosongensis]GIP58632.1 Rrf2 family transcriptional regulator [Paenibacillus woosongensis]
MNSEFTVALHCLLFLHMNAHCIANSEKIAASVATHPARVRKVLSLLKKQGYVSTKEGVGGGYLLSADLNAISLGDLYRLFARGTLQPGWCSGSQESPCQVSSKMREVMDRIFAGGEDQLERYFDEIKVSRVKGLLQELRAEAGS